MGCGLHPPGWIDAGQVVFVTQKTGKAGKRRPFR
jgi:hypothetical protein